MIISCSCGARLKVSDERLTPAGVKVKCPKCSTVHTARKQTTPASAAAAATPSERQPGMPWFAQASPDMRQDGTLVLIAHDSTVVAEMIAGSLKDAGYLTEFAQNGLEALKKAMDLKPQAMVVDVGLTGIYGFELCERLKSDPRTKQIKIILLSSVYGLTAYKRAPVTLYGADDYIEKHHIPDELVPKIRKLLSGEAADTPSSSPAPAEESIDEPAGQRDPSAPLVSRKGVLQAAPDAQRPANEAPSPQGFEMPEIPSVMPSTPVTLDTGRSRQTPASSAKAASPPPLVAPEQRETSRTIQPQPPTAAPADRGPENTKGYSAAAQQDISEAAPHSDGSVRLDAGFFEHDEYEAPAAQIQVSEVDPAEIEKARRFARIIVSDIALYNQEAVVEGIQQGTFYDILKDDISEGRTLYANRVPKAIRATKDYLQEAFDAFIEAKKKLR